MTTTTQSKEKDVPAVPLNIGLLDWFAGQALLSAPDYQKSSDPALTAKWAYEVAVEMVAEKRRLDEKDITI